MMRAVRPFILIAAVRRTGSTMLAEALSELPKAFVFREPKLFRGRVSLKEGDLAMLPCAIDVVPEDREVSPALDAALRFRETVVRPLSRSVEQIGIKEIRYGPRWPEVLDVLGEVAPVKVVALGRDPRDQFLSLAYRARTRRVPLRGTFGPAAIAEDIEREFVRQRELIAATGALTVRYEDLCRDPAVLERIRRFVDSPVGAGSIGAFETDEHVLHDGRVSELRVNRWEREPDAGLLSQAAEVMRRLGSYCRYWGYDG